jgi:hypothetical protein
MREDFKILPTLGERYPRSLALSSTKETTPRSIFLIGLEHSTGIFPRCWESRYAGYRTLDIGPPTGLLSRQRG